MSTSPVASLPRMSSLPSVSKLPLPSLKTVLKVCCFFALFNVAYIGGQTLLSTQCVESDERAEQAIERIKVLDKLVPSCLKKYNEFLENNQDESPLSMSQRMQKFIEDPSSDIPLGKANAARQISNTYTFVTEKAFKEGIEMLRRCAKERETTCAFQPIETCSATDLTNCMDYEDLIANSKLALENVYKYCLS